MLLFASLLLSGASGTTYNDTISETITATDSLISAAIFGNTISESLTASDSIGSTIGGWVKQVPPTVIWTKE